MIPSKRTISQLGAGTRRKSERVAGRTRFVREEGAVRREEAGLEVLVAITPGA
jgi:hypothetical protein